MTSVSRSKSESEVLLRRLEKMEYYRSENMLVIDLDGVRFFFPSGSYIG